MAAMRGRRFHKKKEPGTLANPSTPPAGDIPANPHRSAGSGTS